MGRYEIEGKVVLITGAGNGIGRDVARRLGPMGAKLALVSYYFDHHGDAPYLRPELRAGGEEGGPQLSALRLPLRDPAPLARAGGAEKVTRVTPPKKATKEQKPRRYAPRLPPEERREQLLDATLELIAEKGYESVSMEGIARRAGVTKPVVYDLFGSLADLLEALLEREEERALNQLAELMPIPAEDADPAKVLVDGLDAFLRAVETRPNAWRLSLMPIEAQPGIVREHVERDRTAVAKQLDSIVRWGVERLEVPISDVDLLVQTIIVLAEQGGRMHLDDPERYSRERITAFTASLLDSVRG